MRSICILCTLEPSGERVLTASRKASSCTRKASSCILERRLSDFRTSYKVMAEAHKTRKTRKAGKPRFRFSTLKDLPCVFKAAGVVFTDGKLILAGYQPLKKTPFISGIGGSKEPGESYKETALREMVEELFEVPPPAGLIAELKKHKPNRVLHTGTYVRLVYTFEDLDAMLKLMKTYSLKSPLYDTFPETLMELLFERRPKAKVEISHLCLLPVVKHDAGAPFVVSYFVKEMCDYLA